MKPSCREWTDDFWPESMSGGISGIGGGENGRSGGIITMKPQGGGDPY